jgi:hypothetical protein
LNLGDGDLAGGVVGELEREKRRVADQGASGKLVGFLAGGMVGEGHSGDVADNDPPCIAITSITIISS